MKIHHLSYNCPTDNTIAMKTTRAYESIDAAVPAPVNEHVTKSFDLSLCLDLLYDTFGPIV